MSLLFDPPPAPSAAVRGETRRFPVRRIYCVGRNYVEHAVEMGYTGREPPFFFLKPGDAVLNVEPGITTSLAYPSLTSNFHHEVELVCAIGRGGRDIPAATALEHVYGYAVGLDMTRRDLQNDMKKAGRPWCIGKAFDESAPLGAITPAAQVPGIHSAAVVLEVNGVVKQASQVGKLIWSVAETVEHLSRAWTLAPGDLIYTGTPEGVGAVVAGDVMEAHIEGLDSLRVRVTA